MAGGRPHPANIPPPAPAAKTRQTCAAKERFFLNYRTCGYTFPFTDAAGWVRFIDWMALNGINRPLLQAGQEAVWYRAWKSYGLDDAKIRGYFPGPAHLPWHHMSNLDGWGGPLPMSSVRIPRSSRPGRFWPRSVDPSSGQSLRPRFRPHDEADV